MIEKIKLVLAAGAVAAGIAGFYLLADYALVVRILSVLGGLILGVIIAWFSEPGKRFIEFSKEAWQETRKVVWPTRKEAMQTTGVVFVLVIIVALFLWVVDFALINATEWLLGRGD